MHTLSIAVIGKIDSQNTLDLVNEIHSRELTAMLCNHNELRIDVSMKEAQVWCGEQRVDTADIVIFRAYNDQLAFMQTIAQVLKNKGVLVIDEIFTQKVVLSKLYEALQYAAHEIPHPRTVQMYDNAMVDQFFTDLPLPCIAKPMNGHRGEGIGLLKTMDEVKTFCAKNQTGYIFQEYVQITSDIRVLVVGGEAIGAMRRHVIKNDIRSNVSLGAQTEVAELTPALADIAISAAHAMGIDIAGVDVIEKDGEYMVLETNMTPQWQGFQKATGINVASKIIDFVLRKYEQSK